MHIVITGGGGTLIRPLVSLSNVNKWMDEDAQDGHQVKMVYRADEYHYCIVSVTENGIDIEVIKVEDGDLKNRTLLEEFSIK